MFKSASNAVSNVASNFARRIQGEQPFINKDNLNNNLNKKYTIEISYYKDTGYTLDSLIVENSSNEVEKRYTIDKNSNDRIILNNNNLKKALNNLKLEENKEVLDSNSESNSGDIVSGGKKRKTNYSKKKISQKKNKTFKR